MFAAMIAAVLTQAASGEVLAAPMPDGFKTGYQASDASQSIEERVPVAESVEDWTRMVTIQRFPRIAPLGAQAFAQRFGASIAQACPGAVITPIASGSEAGRTTATLQAYCPQNPSTGKPETLIGRVFEGAADLHMVQYAFRSRPDAASMAAANRYIATVRLRR